MYFFCKGLLILSGVFDDDTLSWMGNNLPNSKILLWVHTHVQGTKCGFSSVDCHNQFALELHNPWILGMVIEINEGQNVVDAFALTPLGKETIRECSRSSNLSSIQHEQCSSKLFYQSCVSRIERTSESVQVFNFFSSTNDQVQATISTRARRKRAESSNCQASQESEGIVCESCGKSYSKKSILMHIGKNKLCKSHYGDRFLEMKKTNRKQSNDRNDAKIQSDPCKRKRKNEKDRKSYEDSKDERQAKYAKMDKEVLSKKNRERYAKMDKEDLSMKNQERRAKMDKKVLSEKNRESYAKKRDLLKAKAKERYHKKKNDESFNKFCNEIQFGPIFPCICCHRTLFVTGVKKITSKIQEKISEELWNASIGDVDFLKVDGVLYMCHSCRSTLCIKRKCPKISSMNGLMLDPVPKSLELTELENQMIAKRLLFMKLKKLPKSRMDAMVDRVVNVPLEDEDVVSTINVFPRSLEESAIVALTFKRKLDMKNVYKEAFIRPQMLIIALKELKKLENPHYIDIDINEEFNQNETPEESEDLTREISNPSSVSSSASCESDPIKKYQCQREEASSVVSNNPEVNVYVNNTTEPKMAQVDGQAKISVAPGEGKVY